MQCSAKSFNILLNSGDLHICPTCFDLRDRGLTHFKALRHLSLREARQFAHFF